MRKSITLLFLIFTLFFGCQKDPCEDVSCFNGACVEGVCVCESGWAGSACSDEVIPQRMTIKSISLVKMPSTDNGSSWDLTTAPDVYISISVSGNVIYTHPTPMLMILWEE